MLLASSRRLATTLLSCLALGAPLPAQVESAPFTAEQLPRVTPVVRVARDVGPSVVNIYQEVVQEEKLPWPYNRLLPSQTRRSTSLGSGVVIDPDGFILTNAHVIQPRGDIQVEFRDGARHRARLINLDTANDVALIKVDAPEPLPNARLGSSSDVMVGETVIAIGNPLGNANTVTSGIVSSVFREVRIPGQGKNERFRDFIQLDAAINPGNSGGPLMNVKGEVIGINWAIRTDSEGIGFAIPIDRVRASLSSTLLNPQVLNDVVSGVQIAGDPLFDRVEVALAQPDSPASRAGLRPGDRLLRVDGEPVRWEFDFNKAIYQARAGDTLDLEIERDGRRLDLELLLESEESPMQFVYRRTGLRVVDHPKFFGVFVESVDPGGPAARLPIRRGDHIDGVNGRNINDLADFYGALRDTDSRLAELQLFRAGQSLRGALELR